MSRILTWEYREGGTGDNEEPYSYKHITCYDVILKNENGYLLTEFGIGPVVFFKEPNIIKELGEDENWITVKDNYEALNFYNKVG